MPDALAALDEISERVTTLATAANTGRSTTVPVAVAQPIASAIARMYFESVRGELQVVQNRPALSEEIDFVVQSLLQLATAPGKKRSYLRHLDQLRASLLEATVDLMKARGAPRLVLSETERSIVA